MRDWRLILREEEREQARLKAMVKKYPEISATKNAHAAVVEKLKTANANFLRSEYANSEMVFVATMVIQ